MRPVTFGRVEKSRDACVCRVEKGRFVIRLCYFRVYARTLLPFIPLEYIYGC